MKKFSLLFIFLFSFNSANAFTCPNYMFSTDLKKGDTNADVRVMQEILNLDKRTIVSYSGLGSKGQETSYFGVGTREALKRFQALFIEYIGIANGKFGPRTRTTMNAVCKGDFFTGGSKNVYDTTSNKDSTPPIVAIAGPNSASISEIFRAFIGSNEAMQTPDLSGLIISNATAGDIRKVSSTTFSFVVTPNQDAKGPITLQFEADSLSDLAGNKNEDATNEWQVVLTDLGSTTIPTIPIEIPVIDMPIVTPSNCNNVTAVDVSDYTNPCYGKSPMTYPNTAGAAASPESSSGGGGSQIAQMLQGLLKGLMGALGGGKATGGNVGGDAMCACSGLKTASYSPIGPGIGGRQNVTGVPNMGSHYTGFQSGPPPICGARLRQGPKDPCSGIPGPHTGSCCGILVDVTLQPVTGTLSPTGMRSN